MLSASSASLRARTRVLTTSSLSAWSAFPATHRRAFSLWPSAPSTEPESAQDTVDPPPPTMSELSTPLSLPDPTFWEPASTALLSLPPALGVSYALFIPLLTLVIRGSLTLPLTLWQRARTRRFANVVMPLLRREQTKISFETRDECRRAGKSFEEYQETYKKRAKAAAKKLARANSASPMLTLVLPPLLHIPIFISTTLLLRDACARALVSLPLTPTSLSDLLPSAPDSLMTATALGQLQDLAATSFLWCPSLILPDPIMALPLCVGIAALLNVEVTAKTRQQNARAALASQAAREQSQARVSVRAQGLTLSAAEKRRLAARVAQTSPSPSSAPGTSSTAGAGRRAYASPAAPSPAAMTKEEREALAEAEEQEKVDPRTARIMTNALRFSAVLFMPIAAMAPSAVCIYWITSNLFTLAQSTIFAVIDRRRERERRLQDIVRRR